MTFQSILYRANRPDLLMEQAAAPGFFGDLNFDQIVAAVTAGRDEYDLKPFFHRSLNDVGEIAYRQQIMQDLECSSVFEPIVSFAAAMREVRSLLRASEQAHYRWHKNGWFLEAAAAYCEAVRQLSASLTATDLRSAGLQGFCEYLSGYIASAAFAGLAADTEKVKTALESIKYSILVRDLAVTVREYQDESDYSAEIEESFAKFRHGDTKDYRQKLTEYAGMGHVDAQIVEFVARLNPEIFATFEQYCIDYNGFIDPILRRFDREVHFYVSYLQYIGNIKRAGMRFCYPKVAQPATTIYGNDVFDLALAAKLASEGGTVVPNDFRLDDGERVLVVSGPNQGGKTTFARALGQLHYLARLGCPVPGSQAQLMLCERTFTHFEKQEDIEDLHGKLQDDLLRIRQILRQATPHSLVIINEIFSSTALDDAVFLATEIMRRVLAIGCLCVCVTFLDEVAALDPSVVSMVSTVVPDDPAQRTFKLVRRPADGRAYAMAIAEKHRLTYPSLKKRLAS